MAQQKRIMRRRLIRGTRAHSLIAYFGQFGVLYDYFPALQAPLARLNAGTYTKSDLDLLDSYAHLTKDSNAKFETLSAELGSLKSFE